MCTTDVSLLQAENSRRYRNWKDDGRSKLQQLKNRNKSALSFQHTLNKPTPKAGKEPQLATISFPAICWSYRLSESSWKSSDTGINFLLAWLFGTGKYTSVKLVLQKSRQEGVLEDISIYPLLFIPFEKRSSIVLKSRKDKHTHIVLPSGNSCTSGAKTPKTASHYIESLRRFEGLKNISGAKLLFGRCIPYHYRKKINILCAYIVNL